MKNTLLMASIIGLVCAVVISPVYAASDYYLKIGDIKGESEAQGSANAEMRVQAVPIEVEAKGNVETSWKVEEGEKTDSDSSNEASMRAQSESSDQSTNDRTDTISVGLSSDASSALRGVYIKLGDIQGETAAHAEFTADTEITVSGVEVRGWDPETKEKIEGTAGSSPNTIEGLAALAARASAEDAHMEEVTFTYSKIKWEYSSQGKFLGFITVPLKKTVTVSTDPEATERVKVRFPWYRFLTVADVNESELETEISAALNPQTEPPSVEAHAQTFIAVSNILKARHDAAMNSIRNMK